MAKKDDDKPVIIIKRVKKVEGGHHGGAWKVAYADFVTAMMAFFLLLWLLNVTTDEQKELISSYFAPTDFRISNSESGAGGVMGGTTVNPEGAMSANNAASPTNSGIAAEAEEDPAEEAKKELDKQDTKAFKATEEKLKEAIEKVPELKELAQNLLIDMTPEGLRIQLVDQEGKPMFESGSAKPLPAVEKLLALVSQSIRPLPNKLSVRGHTDSKQYSKDASYSNWELSADRANASRRLMLRDGLPLTRIENVQGKADREPLVLNDTESPRNRRVSIILLKQSLAQGTNTGNKPVEQPKPAAPTEPQTKKREAGVIYFP